MFIVNVYEYSGTIYLFPMSKTTSVPYFYEFPSLKISADSSAIEVGKGILEAAKRVRNGLFERSPFEDKDTEFYKDTGVKKYVTFINKSRFCRVHPSLAEDDVLLIAPGYRKGNGFLFGEHFKASPTSPEDIGEKVLQALKVYEPKLPKKK